MQYVFYVSCMYVCMYVPCVFYFIHDVSILGFMASNNIMKSEECGMRRPWINRCLSHNLTWITDENNERTDVGHWLDFVIVGVWCEREHPVVTPLSSGNRCRETEYKCEGVEPSPCVSLSLGMSIHSRGWRPRSESVPALSYRLWSLHTWPNSAVTVRFNICGLLIIVNSRS